MDSQIKDTIKRDFERFTKYSIAKGNAVGFELFGDYAVSALNFYVGSNVFPLSEKLEAAFYLTQLFNTGMGNRISAEDMQEISIALTEDATLDYSILKPIFNA